MSNEQNKPPQGYWQKGDKAFIFSAATAIVLFVGGIISLSLDFLLVNVADADSNSVFYKTGLALFAVGVVPTVFCASLQLYSCLSSWQYMINKRRGLPYDDSSERSQSAQADIPIVASPLKGEAKNFEHEIIAELNNRASLRHPRANIAQLLRALIDMNLLDFNIRQKDDLMRWVVQVTGFNETSVSAFNEAVNNATGTKVYDAQKWLENIINKQKQTK
ncbi:MAG: hypothetical protein IJU35_06665 [Paludibacteraceae bacterium]|nr:hypothetical protein [Paludibacteraceae bacterium]